MRFEFTNRCPHCAGLVLGLHICGADRSLRSIVPGRGVDPVERDYSFLDEEDEPSIRPEMEWRSVPVTVRRIKRPPRSIDGLDGRDSLTVSVLSEIASAIRDEIAGEENVARHTGLPLESSFRIAGMMRALRIVERAGGNDSTPTPLTAAETGTGG